MRGRGFVRRGLRVWMLVVGDSDVQDLCVWGGGGGGGEREGEGHMRERSSWFTGL